MAAVHVTLRERKINGRVRTAELCNGHGLRLMDCFADTSWSLHLRHLTG